MASKAEVFWEHHKQKFPYHVRVPHMSHQDMDPKLVPLAIGWHNKFLRVPFDGVAHWGFRTNAARELFKKVAYAPKVSS
jgi:hypothetical protein